MNLWQFYKDNPTLLEAKIGDELAAIAAIVLGTSSKNALNVFVDGGSISSTPSGTQNVSIVSSITLPVSGTFWQATQPVSGAFFQATQPVSGPLTNAELRALAVPVSGTVAISNFPASQVVTGPLTDTQLRAASVPVSGTVIVVPTSSTRTDTYTVSPTTGTTVDVSTTSTKSFALQVSGTGGTATLWTVLLEGSLDNLTFTTLLTSTQALANGTIIWSGTNLMPCLYFRSRVTSLTLGPATDIVVKILGVI